MMVADRARRQLDAVADDVVLESLEPEDRIPVVILQGEELLDCKLRHRKWVVREIDLLLVLVPLIHREIDDPAEAKFVFLNHAELAADTRARQPGQRRRALFFRVRREEQ